jgi:hypothetical protein
VTAVEEIRRAAALMRERATKATPSPWEAEENTAVVAPNYGDDGWTVFYDEDAHRRDITHIASWHPAVALAVADLLDTLAVGIESAAADRCENAYIDEVAVLAVARAYLAGEQR